MVDLAIIIVSHQMRGLVKNCLKSIYQNIASANFSQQIIVVDNFGQDKLKQLLQEKFPSVKYLYTDNKGYSQAINLGLKNCPARYYLVCNPDIMIPGPHSLNKLYHFIEANSQAGLVAPKLVNPDGTVQLTARKFPSLWQPLFSRTVLGRTKFGKKKLREFLMFNQDHKQVKNVDWILGAFMLLRQEALRAVNYFDERYFLYFEDTDLCRQLHLHRWQVIYYPEVEIIHYHGRSSADVFGLKAILTNPITRIHIYSWLKYLGKYKFQALPQYE